MFTGLYNIIIGIVTPSLVGWILVRQLYKSNPSKDILAQLAYSFLSGYGIINLIFTFNVGFGFGFNKYLAYIVMIASVSHFALWVKHFLSVHNKFNIYYIPKFLTKNILIFVVILIGLSAVIYSSNWPVRDWDSIAMYDFRAKVFESGSRIEDLEKVVQDRYYYRYYFGYPYMTSIAHAWVYSFGATTPIPIYAGFYLCLILLFISPIIKDKTYFGVKRSKVDLSIISCIPILVALTPEILSHSTMAYTNLPYTTYFLASLIPLLSIVKSGEEGAQTNQFMLSALMLTSAILTRFTEPFYLSILIVAVYIAVKSKNILWSIIYPLAIYLTRKLWMAYVVFGDELSIKVIPSVISNFKLSFFYQVEKFLLEHYLVNITIPLFIMLIFLVYYWLKTKKIDILFILFWGINLGILFLGGYFFAARMDIWKDIGGSAERMVIVFIPIFYYWAIYLYSKTRT